MKRFLFATTLVMFLVACWQLGAYLDDLDARQATADTVLDRAAESVQMQADLKFAENHHD